MTAQWWYNSSITHFSLYYFYASDQYLFVIFIISFNQLFFPSCYFKLHLDKYSRSTIRGVNFYLLENANKLLFYTTHIIALLETFSWSSFPTHIIIIIIMMTTVHNNNNSILFISGSFFWAVFVRGAVAGGRDVHSRSCAANIRKRPRDLCNNNAIISSYICVYYVLYYYYYNNAIVGPVKRIVVRCCGIPRGYVSPPYVMSTTTHRKNPRDNNNNNNYYYYRYCGRLEPGKTWPDRNRRKGFTEGHIFPRSRN